MRNERDHRDYRHEGGRDWQAEGQRRMQQETRWILMGERAWWGFGGGKKVYCARQWPKVAVGDGGEHAIDCWGASTPEEGRREGGKGLRWEKGALEGEGPVALA